MQSITEQTIKLKSGAWSLRSRSLLFARPITHFISSLRDFPIILKQEKLFFELLRVAIGNAVCLSHTPTASEWNELYAMAKKQSLVGICFAGVQRLQSQQQSPPEMLYLQWMGMAVKIQQRNEVLNRQCAELQAMFSSEGFRSCLLKGQGNALLYSEPLRALRQSGDIDLWIEGSRDEIIRQVKSMGVDSEDIDIKHWPVHFFKDTAVEIHFRPSLFFRPIHDRRFLMWVVENESAQFGGGPKTGIVSPTVSFNLVYLLIHIYRHLFNEGIGLRQLLDYYFVMMASTDDERKVAYETIQSFGMSRFAAAVMYIMKNVFSLPTGKMFCEPSSKDGAFLLEEITIGGNFGKYDTRYGDYTKCGLIERGIKNFIKNFKFVSSYPSEVLWAPLWKVWHRCWLWKKGYLR